MISGNEDHIFELESGHDFGILRLSKKVNFKDRREYLLGFEATNNNESSRKSQKSLHVYVRNANEKPPTFKEKHYAANILESTWLNSPILKIEAESENNKVHYSISNVTSLPFSIDPITGVLKLTKRLDFNEKNFYDFQVKAVNQAPNWKTALTNIRINVLDSNNHSPKFYDRHSKVVIPENFDVSQAIFQAKCLDLDHNENAEVRYRLLDWDTVFRVEEENGKVYLKKPLDYEKTRTFLFNIACENIGNLKSFDTHKVAVFVEVGSLCLLNFLNLII